MPHNDTGIQVGDLAATSSCPVAIAPATEHAMGSLAAEVFNIIGTL